MVIFEIGGDPYPYFFDLHHHGQVQPVGSAGGHYVIDIHAESVAHVLEMVGDHPLIEPQNIWLRDLDGAWKAVVGSLP